MTALRTTEAAVLLALAVGMSVPTVFARADEPSPWPAHVATSIANEGDPAMEAAARVFETRCLRCHSGTHAKLGLSLERDRFYRATVNVPARSSKRIKLIAPGDPDHSMVYLRLLPPSAGGYRGPQMPMGGTLTPGEIAAVRHWVESFPSEPWGAPETSEKSEEAHPESTRPAAAPLFFDSFTAHLPTPDPLGKKMLEFRFTHRFKVSAKDAGADNLYGLDGGAWISLGLAYGVTDWLDVGIRRTNDLQDYEAYSKAAVVRQARGGSPLSLALFASYMKLDAVGLENRNPWSAQISIGRRFAEWLSISLVPSYAARTNYLDGDETSGTAAIGAAAEVRFKPYIALTGEWIEQLGGVKAPFRAGSVGLELRTANHAFHVVLTNSRGTHTNLYLPGGDLDWGDNQFRLGFNISRTFDLGHD